MTTKGLCVKLKRLLKLLETDSAEVGVVAFRTPPSNRTDEGFLPGGRM